MTRQAEVFLRRLKKFLNASPESKRDELAQVFQQITGRALARPTIFSWLELTREPSFSNAIPLLRFMQLNDQIVPGDKARGFFLYVDSPVKNPKAPKKTRRK